VLFGRLCVDRPDRGLAMRLDFTIDIARPVRDVFAIVGDPSNDPKWQSAVRQVTKVSTGPIGTGTRFRHRIQLMGCATTLDIEFRDYIAQRRYVLACVTGPLEFTTEVSFERIALGTRLVTLVTGRPRGLVKLAAVSLSRHRRDEVTADLANLKRLLESGQL
jgi:Polyketide cyclase / dehydrase and lipid transport